MSLTAHGTIMHVDQRFTALFIIDAETRVRYTGQFFGPTTDFVSEHAVMTYTTLDHVFSSSQMTCAFGTHEIQLRSEAGRVVINGSVLWPLPDIPTRALVGEWKVST
ncbi:hypothetical protein JR316_0007555 [Psilocybe cubensis]|uniref:Uncharacterized protein n=2 Tax=Psilocybe cubensis TaxID=181762 RepID=A0ACB8GYW9_PSICU|nr:hypothetical protein JR316_0007555 [Psilocybe cubensis]KAH9480948.1 hypothetical protein JR316_0007555 [Psilocybe cubensis]